MNLYAIRRRDFWGTPEELQKTAARSAEVGDEMADDVRWIRSYVIQEESGKLGTLCIYEGTSPEKVREQAERTGMPADEVVPVVDTVIVRPDPAPAAASA
jgi:sporulation protein YlmC with PRC-barrel domain